MKAVTRDASPLRQRNLRHERLAAAAAFLIAAAVMSPAIRNGYTYWDDTPYVGNNPQMRSLAGLASIWSTRESPQYYPLTFTTYWIEYQLWGESPAGFHAVNVALHACNAALVVILMTRFGMSHWAALSVAVFFAIAPIQVMSVAWLAERKNVLSTLFGLLAMLAFSRNFSRGDRLAYLGGVLAFAAAVLSKSAWLVLPVVLLAQAVWIHRVAFWRALPRVALLLPISIVSAYITAGVEQQYVDADIPPIAERLLIVPGALLTQLSKALWPASLAPFYAKWDASPAVWTAWVPLALVALLALMFVLVGRRLAPLARWGLIAFVCFLAPALGFLPFGNMAFTWASDHFAYYACIGLYAAVVSVFLQFAAPLTSAARLCLGGALLVGVAGAFAGLTIRQIPIWRDALSLWDFAVKTRPELAGAYHGRAYAFIGRREYSKAIADLKRAVALAPHDVQLHYDLATLLNRNGQTEEADKVLRHVLELNPRLTEAHLLLALNAAQRADTAAAIEAYRGALLIEPTSERALAGLLTACAAESRLADAEVALGAALKLKPDSATIQRLFGTLRETQGRSEESAGYFKRAIELNPREPDALYSLGVAAARQKRFVEAIGFYERAVAVDGGRAPFWNNLGCALLDSGRFAEAAETLSKATELDPEDAPAWSNLGIALYESGEKERAIDSLRRSLTVQPDYPRANDVLARIMMNERRYSEAAAQLNHAINVTPPQARLPFVNAYCRLLASCPDDSIRNASQALPLAEKLVESTRGESPDALDTLAMAQASSGLFEEAAVTAERAIQIFETQGRGADASAAASRRDLYRAGKPHRMP